MDEEEAERLTMSRAAIDFARRRDWAEQKNMPDPTYDEQRGWKLDEFAMHFESDLLRAHKRDLARFFEQEDDFDGLDWLFREDDRDLEGKIRSRYLEPQFRVEGFKPGEYQAVKIPKPLLEILIPVCEISALVERGAIAAAPRRYENVRVFQPNFTPVRKANKGGAPSPYDWKRLVENMEQDNVRFSHDGELKGYIRKYLKPMPGEPGKRARNLGPENKTINDAMRKYNLMKFVKTS